MNAEFENILKLYDFLTTNSVNSFEVYASEQTQALANEKGVDAEKWSVDRTALQFGQAIIAEELSRGLPTTAEEQEQRIRTLLSRLLNAHLRNQPNDIARKGVILQTLRAADAVCETELGTLSQLDLTELKHKFVDATYQFTTTTVLPAMKHQCNLLMLNTEQDSSVHLDNAGALATASYLEIPAMQKMPEFAGAVSEITCQSTSSYTADDVIEIVAAGLLVVAGILAFLTLLSMTATVFSAVGAHILVEGTLAGVGAAIAADVAFASGFVMKMLLAAAGTACLSALTKLLGKVVHSSSFENDEDEFTKTSDPYVSI